MANNATQLVINVADFLRKECQVNAVAFWLILRRSSPFQVQPFPVLAYELIPSAQVEIYFHHLFGILHDTNVPSWK